MAQVPVDQLSPAFCELLERADDLKPGVGLASAQLWEGTVEASATGRIRDVQNQELRSPVWGSSPPIVASFTEWVLSDFADSLLEIPIHSTTPTTVALVVGLARTERAVSTALVLYF